MAVALTTPAADELSAVVDVLAGWQHDGAPMQLHPGDLGWFWRFGAEVTAAAVRTWSRDGQVLAIGLLDSPTLLRLAIAPDAMQDEELAGRLADDLTVDVDAPAGALLHVVLSDHGWGTGEPWTPLRRDLTDPVPAPGLRIEVVGPEQVHVRTAVQRAAFDRSTFTEERWHVMAAGAPYADARCLVAYDDECVAVAAATVWSAGRGRPGLLEPLGVHRDHRGRGHGTAIALAAAAALRELGASSAIVCTPSSNVAAVAAYTSAGFRALPEIRDRCRAD